MTALAERRTVRDVAVIGSRWRRRHDGAVVVVRQRHVPDRQVEVMHADQPAAGTSLLMFTELRDEYELLVNLRPRR